MDIIDAGFFDARLDEGPAGALLARGFGDAEGADLGEVFPAYVQGAGAGYRVALDINEIITHIVVQFAQ